MTYILSKCCKRPKCKSWAQEKVKGTYFNYTISLIESQMLLLSTAANINIYKVTHDDLKANSSYYMAWGFLGLILLYSVVSLVYLTRRVARLNE